MQLLFVMTVQLWMITAVQSKFTVKKGLQGVRKRGLQGEGLHADRLQGERLQGVKIFVACTVIVCSVSAHIVCAVEIKVCRVFFGSCDALLGRPIG